MSSRPLIRPDLKHPMQRILYWGIGAVLLSIIFWAGFTAGGILAYMNEGSHRPSDAAVVLGAAVQGENPSPVFRERIEQAVRLYKDGTVRHLIFTGGSRDSSTPTEAWVGRQYAVSHGVRPEHILIETKSVITRENLLYSLEIGKKEGYRTYTIVSDPLHMKRSMKMASELGMDAVPSPTETTAYRSWRSKIPFLVRETVMYMGYTLKGWN
ncbi:YdcF family protein [Paenibacillus sp. AN1007]|uniref:YdcF family protein n=1 Tax=Paenibacillus sp. AN1007 TaxID=3151385 RepID=A0AAU8N2E0_9BACL